MALGIAGYAAEADGAKKSDANGFEASIPMQTQPSMRSGPGAVPVTARVTIWGPERGGSERR